MIRSRLLPAVFGLLFLLCLSGALRAQDSSTRASVMLRNADAFFRELDYAMGLTSPEEQQQTKNLNDHFDVYLIAVDRQRPMRLDLLVDDKPFRYRLNVPVNAGQIEMFRHQNLIPLGLDNRRILPTLYIFRNKVWNGYMRYAHDYANFGELRTDIPQQLADPAPPVQKAVAAQYDAALDFETADPALKSREDRRTAFNQPAGFRDFMLGSLKKAEGEDDDQFAMRKLMAEHFLDELERLYAESSRSHLGWKLDEMAGKLQLDLNVDAIPGTSLEAMVDSLGKAASRFAKVPRREKAILSGRLNHPIDPLRQENLREMFTLMTRIAKSGIETEEGRSDAEKTVGKQVADKIFDLFDANLKAGLADAFAEVWPVEGHAHTGVAALRSVDGTQAVDIIKLLPQARAGRQVQVELEQHGEVQIHSVQMTDQDHPGWGDLFGDQTLYVGTSQDAVWLAAGPNALDELKQAIDLTKEPAEVDPTAPAILLHVNLGPWTELRHKRLGEADDPQMVKWRKLALAAFEPGDDALDISMAPTEGGLTGVATAQPGILRYIGKILADFSKENLEEPE